MDKAFNYVWERFPAMASADVDKVLEAAFDLAASGKVGFWDALAAICSATMGGASHG